VLDLAPDNEVADRAIDEMLAGEGRHAERAERRRAQLERRAEGPVAQARGLQLAGLYERDLGDGAAATAAYAAILDGDPDCAPALAGLERLFAAGTERLRVAALLMPHYRKRGRAADLVRVWAAALVESPEAHPADELLELARSTGQLEVLRGVLVAAKLPRPSLRLALAQVERERGDRRAAEKILRQLLQDDANSLDALRALDGLLGGLLAGEERPKERVEVLARRAALEEPAARVELLLQLAELQVNAAGDPAAARTTLESALALGDDDRVLRALARLADDATAMALWQRLCDRAPADAEALSALSALYEHHERWRELAEVLERQLALALAAAVEGAAAMLVEQLALVWTRLGEGARAEAAWRQLMTLQPTATDPLRALARILRGAERWNELAEILEQLATLDGGAATAAQLARLETETLERPERAIAAWHRVLAIEAESAEALAALEALYARTNRPDERRRMLERRAELALAGGRADACAAAADAAAAAAGEGDATAAAGWYERILAVEPLHPGAQAYLEAHQRERADWPALVALLRLRARHHTGVERGELLAQVCAVEERDLGDRATAFATLLDAFEGDGRWGVHGEDLKRLAAAVDGWPLLAAGLQRRAAAASTSAAERCELYLELGGVLESSRQPTAAIEAYRALLTVEPTFVPALERLERIYRESGQSALLDILARRAELSTDKDEQLGIYRDLAAEAVRFERWARAVEAHRRLAELDGQGERRGVELYRAGVIYRDQLADFDEALGCFESAADSYAADGLEPPAELAEALARIRRRSQRAAERT